MVWQATKNPPHNETRFTHSAHNASFPYCVHCGTIYVIHFGHSFIPFCDRMLIVSSFEPFSGIFSYVFGECVSVLWASNVHGVLAVKCMDDFGLRLIFTLSARLQFTLCSSIINLSYVILLFFVWLLLRFPTVCRFVSHSVVFIFFMHLILWWCWRASLIFHAVKMKVILAIYAFRLLFFSL